ncbi:MAG: oligosaccharide flippase family protein [Flavobacteriia bacterium]|nr:oligosaccharide flippase family protein [Flavobacteriia bacterium]
MSKVKTFHKKYKGEILYTFSNYSTPVITIITNTISAAYLNPKELGTIQTVMIILPYFAFMHFGVFNGLNRNLALYKAQGNHEKVQMMVNASYTVAIINALIGSVIGISYLIYYLFFHYSTIHVFASLLLLLNLILNPISTHFDTTYRSGQNFNTLGKITFLENFIYAGANLLPIWIGYIGKIIANALKVISRYIFRYITQPYKMTAIGKKENIIELSKVGFPLLIGGYLWGIIVISDQTMIATLLGEESLGLYSLSVFMMTGMMVIPTSMNTLLYPKASAQYGVNKNNKTLRPFFWKALGINSLVLIPICLLIYFTIEPLTSYFLPNYLHGVSAAKINLLTCLTFVSNGPSIIIGVVRENTPLLIVYGISLLTIWIMMYTLSNNDLNIEKIAWYRFYISAAISIFTLCYAYYLTSKNKFKE